MQILKIINLESGPIEVLYLEDKDTLYSLRSNPKFIGHRFSMVYVPANLRASSSWEEIKSLISPALKIKEGQHAETLVYAS